MFKKKKKLIPAVKPEPRLLAAFQNYRLVEIHEPANTGKDGTVLSYSGLLVLEEKKKNAMEEPYFERILSDPGPRFVFQMNYNHSAGILFSILKEIYLKELV